ncbi:lipoamide acyltransferase component of branched-chain alpha-keto acid dehydrogenase complex, mitochondrial, partial [Phalaenopsis equestris]|uniref:lipoamide acyltransferase component of branched-chain alpha-keto acid dehydrogenase complex, mitochondrial n=1 Tax=Phalaenopsis equestris TaxID=78828 RepID=UPI0009E2F1B8
FSAPPEFSAPAYRRFPHGGRSCELRLRSGLQPRFFGSNSSIGHSASQLGVSCGARNRRRFSAIQALVDSPALVDVPLAQTGEGIAECELLKWFVEEGDHVEEFQPLCEVQSDKATIEITSRFKGKVHQVLCVPGDIVKVGETMLKIHINETESTSEDDDAEASSDLQQSDPETSLNNQQSIGGVLATPSVRHLAKQHGINVNDIKGSGKDGRVLKEDVLNYSNSKGIGIELPFLSSEGAENAEPFRERKEGYTSPEQWSYEDKVLPLRGFQRSMVNSMTMAAKVPHFYFMEEIKCNALVELKATLQKENTDPDVKHTFLPFLIKSLSMALNKYPLMNSSFNEESKEVILKGCHNIGVAMATPFGLVVPKIKKVQSQSILEVTKELARLQQLAVANKLSAEEISGGTITLSNIGSIGGKFGSPILNLPEVAIIAIGKIQKLPRFSDDDKVYPAYVTNVTIGADHRIVDGATVARFCNEWKLLIEKPELLLLHMR